MYQRPEEGVQFPWDLELKPVVSFHVVIRNRTQVPLEEELVFLAKSSLQPALFWLFSELSIDYKTQQCSVLIHTVVQLSRHRGLSAALTVLWFDVEVSCRVPER